MQTPPARASGAPSRRKTIHDFFQQRLRRTAKVPEDLFGPLVIGEGGVSAQFCVSTQGNRIEAADYRCTACATLLALCEHLAELARGMAIDSARALTPEALLRLHPETPRQKRVRAHTAVAAFQAALVVASAPIKL